MSQYVKYLDDPGWNWDKNWVKYHPSTRLLGVLKWVKKTLKMGSRSCLLGLARWERYARTGPWSFSVTSSWRRGRTAGNLFIFQSSLARIWQGCGDDDMDTGEAYGWWQKTVPCRQYGSWKWKSPWGFSIFKTSVKSTKESNVGQTWVATPTFPDVPCVSSRVNQTWLMWANVGKQNKQWKVKVVLRGECWLHSMQDFLLLH